MGAGLGPILLDVAIILLAAKLAGELFERLRQPAVVGELLVGLLLSPVILGNRIGLPQLTAPTLSVDGVVIATLAGLGAILLLFEVGLESDIRQMGKVGSSSALVAAIGVAASFVVGYAASAVLSATWSGWHAADGSLPPHLLHIFVGAAFTATSVGITARVLADMGRLKTAEARIILGAAVLDDVAGLLILAVVAALIQKPDSAGGTSAWQIAKLAGIAIGFLALTTGVGLWLVPRAYDALVTRFRIAGFPVALAFGFALLLAYAASLAGLADIVGAFVAGLILAQTRHRHQIFESIKPIGALLIGFFFVTIGMKIDADAFRTDAGPIVLAGVALALVAAAAKLACGLGVLGRQAQRLTVGVGMIPRGEVGLIFASLGLASGLLGPAIYASLVLAMLLTTVVTPLWLVRLRQRFTPDTEPAGERDGLARTVEA